MYYCNSRYYCPELCRWISPDDIEYLELESINGLNLYCYCLNNPISYVDPSGNSVIPISINLITSIFRSVLNAIPGLLEDIANFDIMNTDEKVVINSNYFSYYKGSLVIRHSIPNITSCGIFGMIFLNRDVNDPNSIYDINTVKHEWGHNIQEKILGTKLYLFRIGIPSIIGCYSGANNYYSQSWENSADILG